MADLNHSPLAKLFAVFTEALLELRFAQNPFDLRRGFLQRLPVSGFHREKLQLSFQSVIHFKQSGDISRLELRKAVLPCRIKAVPIHDAHITAFLSARTHGNLTSGLFKGKLAATDEEMIAAAKAVNAHEFIMKMEKGYDTELKEHGAGLSIGQRQLIAFARTMISMPKILILDEATSSIDTHTEILVQKGIEALLSGRTSFVIAHRLSTIQNADRIFVIDQGGILEQGSPAELMKKKGAYYDLYMAQFAGLE